MHQIDGAKLLIPFNSLVHQYSGWGINQGRNRERERVMGEELQGKGGSVEGKIRKIRVREKQEKEYKYCR
jgi:hypothetical protein